MKNMAITRIKVNLNDPESWPKGQMDTAFLDNLNEADFDQIAAEEEEEALCALAPSLAPCCEVPRLLALSKKGRRMPVHVHVAARRMKTKK